MCRINIQFVLIFISKAHYWTQPIRFKSAASKKANIRGIIVLINPENVPDKY